ncbi:hypothetical protein FW778_05490 [Ginsengibacter hankyongi]|uniref:Uncharacterized protein n=1 Tax=Ginsengibacter hankyongi TaxID=2607284 RepID=A0A5J5IKE0_9BACT|nr:hypothetical protein [Ginsengibacter hankyongi]KAA9041479.1 hypothetical protein FW778_05490 [Ginsengibacter hankyongi]
MGKQKGLYLNAKSGNILYYSWKEIPCIRTIPANVYQSPAVIAHKNANGLSTTMGASFRRLLDGVLPYPKNMEMQTNLRIALLKLLKSGVVNIEPPAAIPFIGGLSFNEASVLSNCMKVPLSITLQSPDEFAVHLPEMVPTLGFNAPPATSHIRLKIAAACCNIATGEALQNYNDAITIPYNAERISAQTKLFSFPMPAGRITMVVIALDYFGNVNGASSLLLNERFRPSRVMGGVIR